MSAGACFSQRTGWLLHLSQLRPLRSPSVMSPRVPSDLHSSERWDARRDGTSKDRVQSPWACLPAGLCCITSRAGLQLQSRKWREVSLGSSSMRNACEHDRCSMTPSRMCATRQLRMNASFCNARHSRLEMSTTLNTRTVARSPTHLGRNRLRLVSQTRRSLIRNVVTANPTSCR